MNPELQTVVDRLELVERQNRSLRLMSLLALLIAVVAVVLPYVRPAAVEGGVARFSLVEANRFLLRDLNGSVAGGIENLPDGTVRMVLGGRGATSAHFVLPRSGAPQFTLRSNAGQVRVGLDGSDRPGFWLSQDGQYSQVALGTLEGKGGEIWVRDGLGRPRFHAP
jgi:hypothetical protein